MINVCFWCNRAKAEEQAGQPVYTDYEFCPLCKKICEQGITIIQVTTESNGNPPVRDGLCPTGKWVVVSEKELVRVLTDSPILDTILLARQLYVNKNDWGSLKLP
jgi:hypothetical protein